MPVTAFTATTGSLPSGFLTQYRNSGEAAAVRIATGLLRASFGVPQFASTCTFTMVSRETAGTWKLIWVGLTNVRNPALPSTFTHVPARFAGRLPFTRSSAWTARAVPAGANADPKMVARPPGEIVITAGMLPPPPAIPPLDIAGPAGPAGVTPSD